MPWSLSIVPEEYRRSNENDEEIEEELEALQRKAEKRATQLATASQAKKVATLSPSSHMSKKNDKENLAPPNKKKLNKKKTFNKKKPKKPKGKPSKVTSLAVERLQEFRSSEYDQYCLPDSAFCGATPQRSTSNDASSI